MTRTLAGASLALFGVSLLLLVLLTLGESALLGLSLGAERALSFLLLVVPAAIGAALGVISLARREGRTALAVTGIILNTLFALFNLMVILFAG